MYDSTQDTKEHIRKVQARIDEIVRRLIARAIAHDKSKLEEPEKSMYDEWKPKLRLMTEGSPEIIAARAAMGTALQHHYKVNDHHPEGNEGGITGMSLLSLIELFCDWQAAIDEKGGVLLSNVQRERFGIGDQLYAILENTAKELGW